MLVGTFSLSVCFVFVTSYPKIGSIQREILVYFLSYFVLNSVIIFVLTSYFQSTLAKWVRSVIGYNLVPWQLGVREIKEATLAILI